MSDLIDARDRAIVANHLVPIETQQLHALLRIEETLTSILEGMRFAAKQLSSAKDDVAEASPAKARRK